MVWRHFNSGTSQANHLTDVTYCYRFSSGRIDSVELWGILLVKRKWQLSLRLRSKFIPINEVAKNTVTEAVILLPVVPTLKEEIEVYLGIERIGKK